MRACVGAEPGERRGWGGAACEVYGALVERLTAKALRQMQHWTDIQAVVGTGRRLPKCTVNAMIFWPTRAAQEVLAEIFV
jgi:hypothetical protein